MLKEREKNMGRREMSKLTWVKKGKRKRIIKGKRVTRWEEQEEVGR